MQFADTPALLSHFLAHEVITSDSGTSDVTLRVRALAVAQRCVTLYWERPWHHRESSDAISFDATGVAELPALFGWWDRDFGYIVFPEPESRILAPPEDEQSRIMALRTLHPNDSGPVQRVVIHAGQLHRLPARPPTAPEAATMFFHRIRPELVDEAESVDDEWALIPIGDQEVILEGMRAAWDVKSGDGREAQHEAQFRQRIGQLFGARNTDRQPRVWGRPWRPRGLPIHPTRRLRS